MRAFMLFFVFCFVSNLIGQHTNHLGMGGCSNCEDDRISHPENFECYELEDGFVTIPMFITFNQNFNLPYTIDVESFNATTDERISSSEIYLNECELTIHEHALEDCIYYIYTFDLKIPVNECINEIGNYETIEYFHFYTIFKVNGIGIHHEYSHLFNSTCYDDESFVVLNSKSEEFKIAICCLINPTLLNEEFTENKISIRNKNIKIRNIAFSPNPFSDFITIKNKEDNKAILIYDNLGTLQIKKTVSFENQNIKIDCSSLKVGIYYLKIINHDNSYNTYKIVKL